LKSKVLLFGQSAGAALSFAISTLPEAPSLISALAAESGGGRSVAPYDEAQPYFELFAKNLGCELTDLDCLRSKSPAELSAAFPSSSASSITLSYPKGFAPVIDGTIIPSDPAEVGTRVPTIFGSTTADGSLFTLSAYQETFPPTEANYTSFIASNFGPYASLVEKYYPISKFANISSAQLAPYLAMRTIWTHASYTCSAYRGLVKAREKGIPAYAFLWDVSPSCPWQSQLGALAQQNPKIMQLLGATHTSEIPYIFRNMDHLPAPNGTCAFSTTEKKIGDQMASAWTAMANFQSPRSPLLPESWPQFESNRTEGMMVSNDGISFGIIDYSPCELWNEITAALAASGN
jgi:para-nitrobenzyl esterase